MTGGSVNFTIAFDNYQGGVIAAQETVKALQAKYGSAKGTVLDAYGTLQSSALRDRRDGFDKTIRKYPNIHLLSRPTNEDPATTRALVTATIDQFPELDAIQTPTDSLTGPARVSMQAKGRLVPTGDPKHIILVSMDGGPNSLGWLRDKTLDAEISQDPVAYGQICVEMLTKYSVLGHDVPLETYTNSKYFWEKAPIIKGKAGPQMVLPAYPITLTSANDPRQWGNIVSQQWGMKETE
jgi:simple sugar transport system substrate-binding protein